MPNETVPVEADAVWDQDETRVRRSAVRQMLTEQRELLDQQVKTWDNRDKVRTPVGRPVMKDKLRKSGFDSRLAYMGPFLGYWIQNRQIWKGQTQRVKLADVPEIAFDDKGVKVELRRIVKRAFQVFDQDIVASDRLRCPFCIEFRAVSDMEKMAHVAKRHPEELNEYAEGCEKNRAEVEAEEEEIPQAPPPKPRQTYAKPG